ncbi:hypothetical protein K438DRAFT_2029520 [Mycena galopus ATCC 62051]|nr:hypothetical protein K438DRAFT_2029520 [Mycena galopus ATCC 62051]
MAAPVGGGNGGNGGKGGRSERTAYRFPPFACDDRHDPPASVSHRSSPLLHPAAVAVVLALTAAPHFPPVALARLFSGLLACAILASTPPSISSGSGVSSECMHLFRGGGAQLAGHKTQLFRGAHRTSSESELRFPAALTRSRSGAQRHSPLAMSGLYASLGRVVLKEAIYEIEDCRVLFNVWKGTVSERANLDELDLGPLKLALRDPDLEVLHRRDIS